MHNTCDLTIMVPEYVSGWRGLKGFDRLRCIILATIHMEILPVFLCSGENKIFVCRRSWSDALPYSYYLMRNCNATAAHSRICKKEIKRFVSDVLLHMPAILLKGN